MSILELEEFSTIENIRKLVYGDTLWSLMKNNFIEEPIISRTNDVGGTCFEYKKYPISIIIHGDDRIAIHIEFQKNLPHDFKIIKSIDKNSSKTEVVAALGISDFEIDDNKKINIDHSAQIIKYFIDEKYSISFDHNEKIELASIFYDKYR